MATTYSTTSEITKRIAYNRHTRDYDCYITIAAVYGHSMPDTVKQAVTGLGELFTYDVVLELPVKKRRETK